MDLRRPLFVAAGAVVSLLAAVPSALGEGDATRPGQVQLANVVSTLPDASPERLGLPGSTTVVPTSQSYDGRPRSFVLHIPDGLLAPAPLVLALHSHSQGTDAIRGYSRLEQLADQEGFVVAFPSGAGGSWNAGGCCRPGSELGTDDVAFLDEVITLTRTKAVLDLSRITITGHSNGGMMALRYACDRPDVVSSAVSVAGPLVAPCTPSQPVAVLALHGSADGVVPVNGGENAPLGVTFPPILASLEPFRQAGGEVKLQVLPGVGHPWMTRDNAGFDATLAVWKWLRDHPRVT